MEDSFITEEIWNLIEGICSKMYKVIPKDRVIDDRELFKIAEKDG